jgi:UPF0042 nucleotide-binding protein
MNDEQRPISASEASSFSLLLIGGLSGAGKSIALTTCADQGWYVVDNLPVPLFPQFIDFLRSNAAAGKRKSQRAAALLDIDSRETLTLLLKLIEQAGISRQQLSLLFIDCQTPIILRRYSETRRPHPGFDATRDESLANTVQRERSRLAPFREIANLSIDTSELSPHDLRRSVRAFLEQLPSSPARLTRLNFVSFGFKYGAPFDCDLLIDVRFLPNPHFVSQFREHTGLEDPVARYVIENDQALTFLNKYTDLLRFLVPRYVFEGKAYINVGVGCTGGKHRSVAIAEELARRIQSNNLITSLIVSTQHRDIGRDIHRTLASGKP